MEQLKPTNEEKEMLRKEFLTIMQERFIEGNETEIDYRYVICTRIRHML